MTVRYQLKDLTIHRIVEQECTFGPMLQFLPNLSRELLDENRSWLAPHAFDPVTEEAILCFQSYIVRTPHHVVLIDSCIGNDKTSPRIASWHNKRDGYWMEALKLAGLTIEDVDIVTCTHLHADHVGWNTKLENGRWVPTFPNARYLFSKTEYEYWDALHRQNPLPAMAESVVPIVDAKKAELVAGDYTIDDHIRLLPTPGHTPGHIALAAGRQADAAVFTGDLIHSPLQTRYPEIHSRADTDPALGVKTRRAFLERYCDTETLFCTMHFPSPSVGKIKRWGDGFRCEMHP